MCGNIHNSIVEQNVYLCILHDGLQTSISFHPLTLANSADPDEMQHNADFVWSALIAKITDETEIYLKNNLTCHP